MQLIEKGNVVSGKFNTQLGYIKAWEIDLDNNQLTVWIDMAGFQEYRKYQLTPQLCWDFLHSQEAREDLLMFYTERVSSPLTPTEIG